MERAGLARLLGASAGGGLTSQVVEEDEPRRFMASFARALSSGGNVFLSNPSWQSQERSALSGLLGAQECEERGWLMIPSGGTGGGLKFARHDGWTLAAAVEGFRQHFGLERVNAVGVLPLHHVSGFMAWTRCVMSRGTYVPWSWKDMEGGRFPENIPGDCCLSLVPTQLQRLLASEAAISWLRRLRLIFVGGGPAWATLTEEAARLGLPLAPCYGSTETAAMVAALKPEQFLSGVRGCGSALPHARIDFAGGVLRVSGKSVFGGYFPERRGEGPWVSDDLGGFTREGSLMILGRRDDLIVTGGKKVSPVEVEAALRLSGQFEDVAVVGVEDPEWGEAVVACHPRGAKPPRIAEVEAALAGLASFKRPKRYVEVSPWPRNPQGKIDRASLSRTAARS